MSYPFGGHPTLLDYIGWCNQQGCTTKSGVMSVDEKMVTFHTLEAPSGRHVVVSGINMREYLMPRHVAYLDRRLGLDSPFGKVGDGAEPPDN